MPKKLRDKLDASVQRHDSSLSALMTGALERCLRDDVWTTKARNAVSRYRTIVPPAELVDISNQMMGLAMVLESLLHNATDRQTAGEKLALDEASRIYLDARVQLQDLRESLGC